MVTYTKLHAKANEAQRKLDEALQSSTDVLDAIDEFDRAVGHMNKAESILAYFDKARKLDIGNSVTAQEIADWKSVLQNSVINAKDSTAAGKAQYDLAIRHCNERRKTDWIEATYIALKELGKLDWHKFAVATHWKCVRDTDWLNMHQRMKDELKSMTSEQIQKRARMRKVWILEAEVLHEDELSELDTQHINDNQEYYEAMEKAELDSRK